jgi:sec-independent protein translocase protein TatA
MLGPMELVPLAIVALLVFGPANLPKLARSFGEAKKEFQRSQEGEPAAVHPPESAEKQPPAIT